MLKKRNSSSTRSNGPKQERTAVLLPSAIFLYERLSLPDTIQSKMVEEYAEEYVGKLSPFPLEKTAWGYLPERGSRKNRNLLLFAAWGESPELTAYNEEEAQYVLPAFVSICNHPSKEPVWRFLLEKNCLTACHFKPDRHFPDQVISQFEDDIENNLGRAFRYRQTMLDTLEIAESDVIDDGLYRCRKTSIDSRKIIAEIEKVDAPNENWKPAWKTKIGPESTLFDADVRPKGLISHLRNQKSAGRLATRLVWGLAAVFVLMVALQAILQIRKIQATRLADLYEQQQKVVVDVQNKEQMIKSIKLFLDRQLYPFDWMMLANSYRPETMAFRTVSLNKNQGLGISGIATQVGQVNTFTEKLQSSGQFLSVTISSLNTSQREVDFTLNIQTKGGKPDQPPPPTPETEKSPEPENGEEASDAE